MLRKKLKLIRKKYPTTPITDLQKIPRPHKKQFKTSEELINVKHIVSEICGLAPYEKKALDYIKRDEEKKCKRFLKRRLGSLKRTVKKFNKMIEISKE